jgi:2-oxoisovalerate dehydrogenase E2 component (dihydrolipoyl transacylase)
MTRYVFKMPDLGEGTVSAEIVAWHVKPGDMVQEDQIMAEVMTDKAAVEVPAPVTGRVVNINGGPGDMIRVGAELIVFETESTAAALTDEAPAPDSEPDSEPEAAAQEEVKAGTESESEAKPKTKAQAKAKAEPEAEARTESDEEAAASAPAPGPAHGRPSTATAAAQDVSSSAAETGGARVKASPATRRKAREAGIDLRLVAGSGPSGRITPQDFAAAVSSGAGVGAGQAAVPGATQPLLKARTGVVEVKVIGVRRLIAQRMSDAARNIPHFSYVEEVDVTELESLRAHLNAKADKGAAALTYLPFLAAALARVLEEFPQCNAHYDAERGVLLRHRPVHLGVATQTPDGLKVPVVRHAEARTLWDLSDEIRRVSDAARVGKATREELTGSTITITSLGRMGGIVSTPIINAPEMGIIGVNKAIDRPVVLNGSVAIRRIMNLSSSFDHRFVDGYDAAAMILALKDLLEHPATIFIPG